MVSFGTTPTSRLICSCASSTLVAFAFLMPTNARAQSINTNTLQAQAVPKNVQTVNPSALDRGIFNIDAGKRLMAEADSAIAAQNYSLAAKKLQDARQLLNQMSNFYQALTSSFLGVDLRASDSNRRKALETAQLRDQATYQLALVHRAQNQPELAVPLLIEIIRSQNPSRDLGQKSYQQLLELGFVDVPYPRQGAGQSPAPQPSSQLLTPAPGSQQQ